MEGKWALASAGGGRVGRRGLGDICRSQRTRRKSLLTFPFFVLGSPLPIKSQFSPLAMDEASHSGMRLEREPTTVVLPAALIPVSARLFAIPCARGTAPQVGRVAMVADTLALNSSLESLRASPDCPDLRPVHAGSGLLGDFSWSDQRSIQATMALEKEESFYSASEEAEELKGDKGIYVRRKSSTSADVKPKVILEHAGREGERVQSTSVVLEEEKPRPLARRKSQLGRDLQASISNSKPIPPLRTEDQVRDEVENNDSKMPSASTSARVGPEAADKVNGVGASAKISAGTILWATSPTSYFARSATVTCKRCGILFWGLRV